jgi:hypothetical protein
MRAPSFCSLAVSTYEDAATSINVIDEIYETATIGGKGGEGGKKGKKGKIFKRRKQAMKA